MGSVAFAVILLIVVLAAALLLRDRLARPIEAAAAVAFVALAALALSAVFVPGLYRTAADQTLASAGVLARIQQLDDQLVLNSLSDLSTQGGLGEAALESLLETEAVSSLLGRLGLDATDLDAGDEGAQPAAPTEPTRLIEENLYPSLVAMVAALYRIGALIVAATGMVAVVGLGFAAAVAGNARGQRETLAALELRVERLESAQSTPAARTAARAAAPRER